MSRHRNVRSMNYSEEYEGYDDVYGHSVEDDYTISPSDAAFMYDRTNKPQMSAFFTEDDIAEEDENVEVSSEKRCSDPNITNLQHMSEVDRVRLQSCLDEIRNVIGDSIPEPTIIKKVLAFDFDVNKTLDAVLSEATANPKPTDFQPTEAVSRTDKVFREPVSVPQVTVAESTVPPSAQPTVKIVLPINVTRGFDVSSSKIEINSVDGLNSKSITPRTQSPASGRQTPITSGRQTPNTELGDGDFSTKESRTSARSRISKDDILAKYASERGGNKEQVHMVVIGHVDAGKSTLMGRLLFELGQVQKKTMHKYEQESRKLGKQSFVYAWILDETGEERSRGITMDVAQSKFETDSKIVTLLDAPGHKDFIPNMITGASQADVALLVVDATRGEFETGFESGGQTREHALLVRSLGVSQIGVVVNKLDTVDWSQGRFTDISEKMSAFLKQAGFRENEVTYVPCSGMTGQNLVVKPTEDNLLSWYNGPTLLDVIDQFKTPERPVTKPFRLSVNDIFKGLGSGFCVSGKIETGMLQTGYKVLIQPLGETATVKALTIDEVPAQVAFAGDYVSATLAGVDQQNISVGNVICDPCQPISITSRFEARIVLFQLKVPLTKGYSVVLHHQSLAEQAVVTKLISQLHKSNGTVVKKSPRCLLGNTVAVVEIRTSRPVCMELYSNIKELGRVMMRVGGVTIAAGLVTKIHC